MNVCQFLHMTWRDVHNIVRQEVRVHTVRRLITIKQSPETGRWIHSEFSMYKCKQVKPGFYHYELHCLQSKQTRKQSSKETKRLVHKLRVLMGITNCNRRFRCFRRVIHVQSERDYKNLKDQSKRGQSSFRRGGTLTSSCPVSVWGVGTKKLESQKSLKAVLFFVKKACIFAPPPTKKSHFEVNLACFEREKTHILSQKFSGLNHSLHIPNQRIKQFPCHTHYN